MFALVAILLTSCKSDQTKADEFVKTLDKKAVVLLQLPSSAPKCVFYTEDKLIKCHNVDNDSTRVIPYGEVDEESVTNVLAGKTNIMVTTQDKDGVERLYFYDVAKGKFTEATPGKDMVITDSKLSKSNQTITVSFDADLTKPSWKKLYYNLSSNKIAYSKSVNTYNFDGKLLRKKITPVTSGALGDKLYDSEYGDEDNYESSSYEESKPVYVWQCRNCGEQIESMEMPDFQGCNQQLMSDGTTRYVPGAYHSWQRMGQVR